ncbi:hypothetical protein QJS10_CPA03g01284 [Acorus calamus]|uniref:Uncharacterized protein n=1 Tax=Acorus calamus TaxID=4465 RepID=A0AAV9F7H0_ACOCL|nr:hypothetical protein QJS10_CPA03g01284 [Acorus calamus]
MEETKKLLENHFKNFFKGERLWLPSWKDECLPCILPSFGEDLEPPFSEKEVREAIFGMDTDKRQGRYECPEIDLALAEKDAKTLYKAGEKRLGTNEDVFIQIFSHRSRAQLAAVVAAYHCIYGTELTKVLYILTPFGVGLSYTIKAVKKETSGDFEYALLTILRCAENPAKYFAKRPMQKPGVRGTLNLPSPPPTPTIEGGKAPTFIISPTTQLGSLPVPLSLPQS